MFYFIIILILIEKKLNYWLKYGNILDIADIKLKFSTEKLV